MKINPAHKPDKPSGTKRKRTGASGGKGSFGDVLSEVSKGNDAQLENLFIEIDESGKLLRNSPGLDTFKAYRQRIADFIKEFLDQAYDVSTSSEMTLAGRQQHMILVRKIDDRLEQMYQEFLKEVFDIGELMKGMEEVRGMLLDMYQ